MELSRLIYVSRAVGGADVDLWAMSSILHAAERNNYQFGLTGMLLAHDGYFCQALEGSAGAIQGLMAILQGDRRHEHIQILGQQPISARSFGDWTMAQVVVTPVLAAHLAGLDLNAVGFDDALRLLSEAADQMKVPI